MLPRFSLLFAFALPLVAQANLSALESTVEPEKKWEAETWNVHAQATVIPQGHGMFTSPYNVPGSSLSPGSELKTSETATIFTGAQIVKGTEVYLNPEMVGGEGISNTHGIAAFTNGEIYRVGEGSAPKVGISRFFLRQTLGWGDQTEKLDAAPNQIAVEEKVSRVTLTAGKFSLNDLFDSNAYAHDPRTQFMNWSLMDNGAWDYAADTHGYTWGFVLELNQPSWAVRVGSVMEPLTANAMEMDPNISKAHGENVEFEYRYSLLHRPGKARVLGFWNHANMGNYRETINNPTYGMDVTKTRAYSSKYGFGLNFEQEITPDLGSFVRLGWNDGATETWAFTEVDRTVSLGFLLKGTSWGRRTDNLGLAYIINGLSNDHRDYLAAGGQGFMIGDGKINYGLEQVVETFYSLQIIDALSLSADIQEVFNPGYNKDRGPVTVFSGRVHAEL